MFRSIFNNTTNDQLANNTSNPSGSSMKSLPILAAATASLFLSSHMAEAGKTLKWFGHYGDWTHWTDCGRGAHVNGFKTRVEKDQRGGDDTAMNAIRLTCSNGGSLTPHNGLWGGWGPQRSCPGGYTGAKVKIESKQGGGDDTSLNCVEMYCSNTNSWTASSCGPWGDWDTEWCGSGQKVCGAKVRFERDQRGGDDTAMNGLQLKCC